MNTTVRVAIIAALCVIPLSAHDLYLRPSTFRPAAGQTIRVEYHNGDSFPNSEVPVKVERLRDAQIWSASGVQPFANLRIEGPVTVADVPAPNRPGTFILSSRTAPNFIELDARKFENYLRSERLGDVVAWRKQHGESTAPGREIYSKYVKAIGYTGAPSQGFDKPLGLALEFIPLSNPYELKAGQALRVRVLFRGQPKTALAVEALQAVDGKVSRHDAGLTDSKGEIRVAVAGRGLWKLHTILMERRTDRKDADWESFWASLTFDLR